MSSQAVARLAVGAAVGEGLVVRDGDRLALTEAGRAWAQREMVA